MIRVASLIKAGAALGGIVVAGGFAGLPANSQPAGSPGPAAAPHAAVVVAQPAERCAGLNGMQVESGSVDGAQGFAAGEAITGGITAGAKAAVDLCRVRLRLRPVAGSEIAIEVWLPAKWNNKLMGLGGGGFDGGLSPAGAVPLNQAAAQGYAAVASDAGHTPAQSLEPWVHGQPEKIIDFGHRSNHLAAVVAKQVVAAYYGNPPSKAYFVGCSNGGRDGIMAASRYPEDYDGIVAGAPALRYIEVVTQLILNSRSVHGAGGAPELGSKQGLVHAAIMRKCDGLDGVSDGILENPMLCRFDPASLRCNGEEVKSCLSSAEVTAFRRIYGGTRLRSGQHIFSGPALGSEGIPGNWDAWVTGPIPAIAGQEFYRWMVYDDPKWEVRNFDLDRDYAAARARLGSILNADDPDLGAFTRRGGKLIIYQGWDDPAITAGSTIAYHDAVRRRIGPVASRQVRLFMVPGMMHCGGGPGATSFDMQAALEKWVEQGTAPERVLASRPDSEELPLTRPLCAWPAVARYRGTGSTRAASSFDCKRPG